jgi:hypothetical protein
MKNWIFLFALTAALTACDQDPNQYSEAELKTNPDGTLFLIQKYITEDELANQEKIRPLLGYQFRSRYIKAPDENEIGDLRHVLLDLHEKLNFDGESQCELSPMPYVPSADMPIQDFEDRQYINCKNTARITTIASAYESFELKTICLIRKLPWDGLRAYLNDRGYLTLLDLPKEGLATQYPTEACQLTRIIANKR